MPPSPFITIAADPTLGTLAAVGIDRTTRQLLERAGFVRDDATGLHRLRRSTSAAVGTRIAADATRLLTGAGYRVVRLYSEAEQQEALAPCAQPERVMTREPGTIWMHHVAADIASGQLVVHARSSAADGTYLLAEYPATGEAAVLTTEGNGFFGATHYADLDRAKEAFGHPLALPPPPREHGRAAAASASPTGDHMPPGAPAETAARPAVTAPAAPPTGPRR
ncbi:hypothetical protein [Kitasatospora sp. NPDC057015]|uniref:hypothetical protein n=1 Tax=Kitasatospora sp. NPDC057015 TaxID=3346001 RepID=UPI0036457C7A